MIGWERILILEYLYYLIIILIAIGVSFILRGFIDKFVSEDKNLEDFYKDIEENKDTYSKEEIKKRYKVEKEKAKVEFKPKFNIAVCITTIIAYLLLFIFKTDYISFGLNIFLISLLIISMFADIKACIIPDEVNFVGFIVGIAYVVFKLWSNIGEGLNLILGGISGFLIFLCIGALGYLLFKKEGMGGGDIKMMGVIGLFLGFQNVIQVFILSFLIGAIISIFLLVTRIKKRDDYIPFGPFIVIATYFTMFFPAWYVYNQIYRFLMYNL